MKIGTIVQAKYFNGVIGSNESLKYQTALKDNFQQAGMFAFGQMPFIAKGPNVEEDYDWKNVDDLVGFGEREGVEILYNTVINSHDGSFPEWYKKLNPAGKLLALERHVKAVVGRYKGKISVYKLVNESRTQPEVNLWGTNLSRSELIAKISHWAREAYADGIYILNDHIPFLRTDEMRDQLIKLIRDVKDAGGDYDAIGIEGHLGYRPIPFQLPTDEEIKITLDEVHNASGLPIQITEFDLSYNNGPVKEYPGCKIDPNMPFRTGKYEYSNWYEYQAYAYKHFLEFCENLGYVNDLVFWGFLDDSKITWERPGTGFFNEDFSAKPALSAIKL